MSIPVVGNIRAEWDWVKKGIEKILQGQPQLTFRPEDVYVECVNGTATLFVDEHKNFAVTTIQVDQYTNKKIFLIWLAYCSNKGLRHKSFIEQYIPFFEQVARDCQCSFVEARTAIGKLSDYYENNGWNLDTKVFTRKL
tara:strand:+ start:479 stop:895 length:417 start_codon:yes stop_codon:yes gene_type:complete